jgi:hypothetical protein
MDKWSDKARRYTERAEMMRAIAMTVRNPNVRATYLRSAKQYEEMADFARKAATNNDAARPKQI